MKNKNIKNYTKCHSHENGNPEKHWIPGSSPRMTIFNNKFLIYLLLVVSCSLSVVSLAQAEEMIPYSRVVYRPDGGVSIIHALVSACKDGEQISRCLDREQDKNETLKGLPSDDVPRDQIPTDRSKRDKWTGEKGRGIHVDKTKVTKNEKILELQAKLDTELEKSSPSSVKVAKLGRLMEKVKDYKSPNNLIPPEKLADFDADQNQSFLASVVETVTSTISLAFDSLLTSIQNGFLALKELVTDTLKVGTPEKPAGITIYDQTTKQPYCLIVKDGQLQSVPGACGVSATANINDIVSPYIASSTQETSDVQNIDNQVPVITLNGPAAIEIEKGTSWTDPGATVIDPAVGDIPANTNLSIYYKLDGVETSNGGREPVQIDTSVLGSHTIIYSATDSAGNIGIAERTVSVVAPVEAVIPPATTTPSGE